MGPLRNSLLPPWAGAMGASPNLLSKHPGFRVKLMGVLGSTFRCEAEGRMSCLFSLACSGQAHPERGVKSWIAVPTNTWGSHAPVQSACGGLLRGACLLVAVGSKNAPRGGGKPPDCGGWRTPRWRGTHVVAQPLVHGPAFAFALLRKTALAA
jgi:hypothetical protein